MKTFCQSCTESIVYESKRPNYCPYCSHPMNGASAPPRHNQTQARARQAPPVEPEWLDEEGDYNIDKNDIKLEVSTHNTPVKFQDVIGSGGEGDTDRRPGVSPEAYKEFLAKMYEKRPEPTEIS